MRFENAGWEGMRGWLTGMALKIGWGSLLTERQPIVLAGLPAAGEPDASRG